ncbi:hypothetical protein C8R44DRAFT_768619 [Mycena epipterygia]|nr:hypothetical protein C8R44DRAFT_768619 [Mycena epipterygia]
MTKFNSSPSRRAGPFPGTPLVSQRTTFYVKCRQRDSSQGWHKVRERVSYIGVLIGLVQHSRGRPVNTFGQSRSQNRVVRGQRSPFLKLHILLHKFESVLHGLFIHIYPESLVENFFNVVVGQRVLPFPRADVQNVHHVMRTLRVSYDVERQNGVVDHLSKPVIQVKWNEGVVARALGVRSFRESAVGPTVALRGRDDESNK